MTDLPAESPRAKQPWQTPRAVLAAIVLGVACVLVAYAGAWSPGGAPGWASWAMVAGVALLLPGTLLLGALRPGRDARRLVAMALLLGLLLLTAFGAALLLPTSAADEPLLLGLPRRAAIVIYGIGLLPMLLLPWAFARDFRDFGLDAERLERIRRECARLQQEQRPDGGATTT